MRGRWRGGEREEIVSKINVFIVYSTNTLYEKGREKKGAEEERERERRNEEDELAMQHN